MLSMTLKTSALTMNSNNYPKETQAAIIGSIIHSIAFGELEIIQHGAIIYSKSTGIIERIDDFNRVSREQSIQNIKSENVIDYTEKLILPGFVDAHCHAPQYVFAGTGMDLPLLQWLEKYTFPCESKFSDLEFARTAYEKSVKRHLKYGTTFASYFATIHASAARVLVDVIHSCGQRAHVGKVSMDRNSPDFYIEDTAKGCKEAEQFVRDVLEMTPQGRKFLESVDKASSTATLVASNHVNSGVQLEGEDRSYVFPNNLHSSQTLLNKPYAPLVFPCITPRFVPTCTSAMMHQLGQISAKYGLPVQSHLSESPGEIAWVSELHPEQETYAEVYYHHGLLHQGSYMAHCCHSDEIERNILGQTGCGVVHCASSNFMLGSGVMDVRQFIEQGIKVALGSDVAGGYSPSMLDAIRQSIIASNCCSMDYRDGKKKTPTSSIRSSTSMPSFTATTVATSLPTSSSSLAQVNTLVGGPGIKRSISFDNRPKMRSQSDLSLSMLSGMDDEESHEEMGRVSIEQSDNHSEGGQFILDDSMHGQTHTTPIKSLQNHPSSTSPVQTAHDEDGMTSVSSLPLTNRGMGPNDRARKYEALNYKEVYHIATQGGAEVLGMGDVVGNFFSGKKLDAIIVDVSKVDGPIDIFGHEDTLDMFQKFLFLGDDRNIISVFVDGKMVL